MATLTPQEPTKQLSSLNLNKPENQEFSSFSVSNFAIKIPSELFALPDLNLNQNGVVGTVTFLKNSAMVWVGWGILINDSDVSETSTNERSGENRNNTKLYARDETGHGTGMPNMGPMVVAMPRTKYAGFSSGNEAPCSQLIGGENEEEVLMGTSMASRLAKKIGCPIFVSCSLGQIGNIRSKGVGGVADLQENAFGDDMGSLSIHAAALAEKKIGEIILERKKGVI